LFSDLKDFTLYSDQNPPERVINELNTYLGEMEDCITQFYRHIDKYIGDGIMVELGSPRGPHHARSNDEHPYEMEDAGRDSH
jgi:adenylate cyclase